MKAVFIYGALMYQYRHNPTVTIASIPNHRVAFVVKGVSRWEPAYAALIDAPSEVAWGVLITVDGHGWKRMCHHEIAYESKTVQAITDSGQTIQCFTLVPKKVAFTHDVIPSARYSRMLYLAAKHHQLPIEVCLRYKQLMSKGSKVTLFLRCFSPLFRFLLPYIGPIPSIIVSVLSISVCISLVIWVIFLVLL